MANPKLILLDEPSMGLAPIFINEIFDIIKEINKQGTTVLLIEQNAKKSIINCRSRLRSFDREGSTDRHRVRITG